MDVISMLIRGVESLFEHNILFLFRRAAKKNIILQDLKRWQDILKPIPDQAPSKEVLLMLFRRWPEYRNLFYYRFKTDPLRNHFIYRLTQFLYPPKYDLVLNVLEEIGPGFFIQHGRSSGVLAKRIGVNCFINQHIVIGYNTGEHPPVIGDNVAIRAGAKVLGSITIGDNSIIGANAVVVKDVPPNCLVVGVPGRIIKRDGRRVDEPL